ncbi:PTS sugar transporter subunit IIB [Bacteroides sp. OttesenSCG-928-J23]|nr:PTS sugar transporter subunit IIB [Bacteroides sp. OttesenSCG-928-J23]
MAINFIRIDDRLIHGQVVVAWSKFYHAGRIWIVDDEVAKDDFLTGVLKMVAPSGIELVITGTEGAAEKIADYESGSKNTMILVKSPMTAQTLFDAGLGVKELNVGGMGANSKRKALYKNISASDEELVVLRELEGRGMKVYFQATPTDRQVLLSDAKK